MFNKGGLVGMIAVAILWYFADWGFYMSMPMSEDVKAAFGTVMHTQETMPNPLIYFLMELGGALVLAYACLQVPLTNAQAAKNGGLVMLGVLTVVNVGWYMSINVPWPMSSFVIEGIYRVAMGAIGGVLMVWIARKMA